MKPSLYYLALTTLTLQGCVLAPGMEAQSTGQVEVEQGTVVRVQPITMNLVDRLDAERLAEMRSLVDDLAQPKQPYRVGPGDVLQITVWDHPELTIPAGSFRDAETSGQQVGEDGMMYYPYVGSIRAAGKTTAELRREITSALAEFIQDPQLDVRVIAHRSQKVYVVGEVLQPGVLPLNDLPLLVVDAINLAGGLTPEAYKGGVNVSRGGRVYEIDLRALYDHADSRQNLVLQDGDIVNVPDLSHQRVFVMGEILRPGAVPIMNGYLTLAAALGETGGVNQNTADPSNIFVIRGADEQEPSIYHLDAEEAYGLVLAERFELEAQDIVFVDTAAVSSWNRVISQLLPSFTVLSTFDRVGGN